MTWNQELTINKNLYREMSSLLQFHLHFMHSHFLFISALHLERPPKRVFCSFSGCIYIHFWSCNLLPCIYFFLSSWCLASEAMKWGRWRRIFCFCTGISWDANFTTTSSQTRNGTHNVVCISKWRACGYKGTRRDKHERIDCTIRVFH